MTVSSAQMCLFLDISRLHRRGQRTTPSGIDRVEYAYLSYTMEKKGSEGVFHILSSRMQGGALRTKKVQEIYERVYRGWFGTTVPSEDAVYVALKAKLERPIEFDVKKNPGLAHPSPAKTSAWSSNLLLSPRDLLRGNSRLTRRIRNKQGSANIYIHTSHSNLDQPDLFKWLKTHDIPAVFFLHDIIPIDFPEFCRPGDDLRHLRRLKTISELAALVLVNSNYTAARAQACLTSNGWRIPEFAKVPLGVESWFQSREGLNLSNTSNSYAVYVGTIEPRKNLGFLFEVWRRLVEQYGHQAPRLVIVGKRGWENENIVDILERSHFLAPFVIEVADLGDVGMASIISGASLLVAPSIVEGFNLPIVEALTLGVPVIASNIEVHREISEGHALLVDPIDGPAWVKAIAGFCGLGPMPQFNSPAKKYDALTWPQHVEAALRLIHDKVAKPLLDKRNHTRAR